MYFEYQLENFIYNVWSDKIFWGIKNLNEHSIKLVELNKHLTHAKVYFLLKLVLVYLLLKLVLTLLVARASVKRSFSAMTFIKNRLRNRMGDEFLNDNLVTYMEHDIFENFLYKDIAKLLSFLWHISALCIFFTLLFMMVFFFLNVDEHMNWWTKIAHLSASWSRNAQFVIVKRQSSFIFVLLYLCYNIQVTLYLLLRIKTLLLTSQTHVLNFRSAIA